MRDRRKLHPKDEVQQSRAVTRGVWPALTAWAHSTFGDLNDAKVTEPLILACYRALDARMHIAGYSLEHWMGAFLSYGLNLPQHYRDLLAAENLTRAVVERHALIFAYRHPKTFYIEYEPDFAVVDSACK